MIRFLIILLISSISLFSQEKYTKDKVFFSFGGEMVFLTMNAKDYVNYYRKELNNNNTEIRNRYNIIGGGGYVGAGYIFLNRMSFSGYFGVDSLPSVYITNEFSSKGVTYNDKITIKRNYFTIYHEYEVYALPYRQKRFNISFTLLTGVSFLLETEGIRENNVIKEVETGFDGALFAFAPGIRFHVRMNEQGDFQFGYRQMLLIDSSVYHFGSVTVGLAYNFQFKKKKEIEDNQKQRLEKIKKRNI